jgi:serine/threonine-protein kinase ATR
VLLNHIEGLPTNASNVNKIMPYAVEGAWVTSRWESLDKFIQRFNGDKVQDFNMSIASLLASLTNEQRSKDFTGLLASVRGQIASSMTSSTTTSLQAAHDQLLRCHVLTDLELIVGARDAKAEDRRSTMTLLDARMQVIGAYFNDKQYVLGVQRAAMQLLR